MRTTFFFIYIYYQFSLDGNLKKRFGTLADDNPINHFLPTGPHRQTRAFFHIFYISTVTTVAAGFLASINTHARADEWTAIPHNNIILLSNLPRSSGTVYICLRGVY
jgi:hypothetical protein